MYLQVCLVSDPNTQQQQRLDLREALTNLITVRRDSSNQLVGKLQCQFNAAKNHAVEAVDSSLHQL